MMKQLSSEKSKNNMNNNQESSLHQCYRFIQYYSLKMIGLSPWTMRISNTFLENQLISSRKEIFSISYIGILYNILFFLGIIAFGMYRILDDSLQQIYAKSLLKMIIIKLVFITLISASFIPLIYVIQQKLIMKANNRFKNVDILLNKCTEYTLENDYINDIIFTINILINISLITLDLLNSPAIGVFFESIPSIISSGVIIQYASQLNKINRRFSSVYSAILKLENMKFDSIHLQSVTQIVLSRTSVLYAIETIKKAYIELCEMCELITDFYGIPILIAIFSFSIRAIFTVYFVILSIVRVQIALAVPLPLFGIRIIFTVFLFTVLTCSVTSLTKQNKKLALVINFQSDQSTVDDKVEKNLSKFATDLWHLKIEITACNIIPLDRTLLAIVIGTIATYLIIGIQFALSSQSTSS